ncbi:hypothetical protein VNI00_014207 [Paramarasmius palmivorus]|uniref:Uncharacterized protein n=1 Tax=Paramarasmius palmivorus TaxID=297713 RepID=A0AAW0BUK9_9AGAR
MDLDQLDFVVTEGEDKPTKENSIPLCSCGTPTPDHGAAWERADGRGSIVWFNQATMFQTSELGYDTVKEAKAAGGSGTCKKNADDVFSKVSR